MRGGGSVLRVLLPQVWVAGVGTIVLGATTALLGQAITPSPAEPAILRVQLDSNAKIKLGTAISAYTVEPLYRANLLVVPTGTRVTGKITEVMPPERKRRLAAASRGDFSPTHDAQLQFDTLVFPGGVEVPLASAPAEKSNEVIRFRSTNGKRPSFVQGVWADLVDQKNAALSTVTAPNKADRFKRYVYDQLPWRPESLRSGAHYDVLLREVPGSTPIHSAISIPPAVPKRGSPEKGVLVVRARLQTELNSSNTKENETVRAFTTEPAEDSQNHIDIPQGAILEGSVLRMRRAKSFGRNGALRFDFTRILLPGVSPQTINGTPGAMDGPAGQSLRVDAEGGVEPDSNRGIVAPLAMSLLAASALHDDEAPLAHAASAANGFGLAFRVMAIITRSRTFGGVVGGVAAARTIYSRFLAHGHDVKFPRNSEIELELARRDAAPNMRP